MPQMELIALPPLCSAPSRLLVPYVMNSTWESSRVLSLPPHMPVFTQSHCSASFLSLKVFPSYAFIAAFLKANLHYSNSFPHRSSAPQLCPLSFLRCKAESRYFQLKAPQWLSTPKRQNPGSKASPTFLCSYLKSEFQPQ